MQLKREKSVLATGTVLPRNKIAMDAHPTDPLLLPRNSPPDRRAPLWTAAASHLVDTARLTSERSRHDVLLHDL